MALIIEEKNGEEIRWINGVPYSDNKPPYGEPQAWNYYLNVEKPAEKKYKEEIHKKWSKIL